jgi:hypothetical protein
MNLATAMLLPVASAHRPPRCSLARAARVPLYRYQSTDSAVLDGALFTFAEGTDTEVIMLIEARQGDRGFVWNYALARMNSVALRVLHRRREVWSVPTISWEQAFDPHEPYTLFTFRPGQGVNPPE